MEGEIILLSKKQIEGAYKCYDYQDDILFVLPEISGKVYCYHKDTLSWWTRERESFAEILEKETTKGEMYRIISGEQALLIMEKWQNNRSPENALLDKAIVIAVQYHAGQYRKCSTTPYILHPLEVMAILRSMGADIPLMIAGVLHDTVEDTHADYSMLHDQFGDTIAKLIGFNTEDKTHSWEKRKQHTIDSISIANKEERMLLMADKTANLRTMAEDLDEIGEKLWQKFGAPKVWQEWYYRNIWQALSSLAEDRSCRRVYEEMGSLIDKLFGSREAEVDTVVSD